MNEIVVEETDIFFSTTMQGLRISQTCYRESSFGGTLRGPKTRIAFNWVTEIRKKKKKYRCKLFRVDGRPVCVRRNTTGRENRMSAVTENTQTRIKNQPAQNQATCTVFNHIWVESQMWPSDFVLRVETTAVSSRVASPRASYRTAPSGRDCRPVKVRAR